MSKKTDSVRRSAGKATHNARPRVATNRAPSAKRDLRFRQLLHKARGGDGIAVHDLWAEYQFDYAREGGRHDLD